MARKSFIDFLFSKNKAPLYVDAANHVQEGDPGNYTKPDGQPARLKYSPEGWKDSLVKFARNIKYMGLFRDFTVPMKFPGDGAKILREMMWMFGVNAIVYFAKAKFDRTALPYTYTSWYMGELDFSKYVQTKNGVQVMAVEGGLTKLIKSNENTVYEIPISDDPEKFYVEDDGVVIENLANYYVNNGVVPIDYGQHTLDAVKLTAESASLDAFDSKRIYFADNAALFSSNYYLLRTGQYVSDVRFRYSFGFTCALAPSIPNNPAAGGRLLVRAFDDDGVATDAWVIQDYGGSSNMYQHHTLTGDVTISNVPANRKLFICQFFTIGGVIASGASADESCSWAYDNNDDDFLKINYYSRFKTTYIESLTPMRVAEKLLGQMTNNLYQVQSAFLESKNDIALTCGDAIRGISGIPNPNRLKTSLTDLFKSFGIFSIGLTVKDEKLIIEPLAYFFQDYVTADIGVVDDPVIEPAEDLMFNTLRAGYKEVEYNDVNGKLEFNQGQLWSTPGTRVVKELDIRSTYRADPIGQELLRINYDGLSTTDAKDDGEVFMKNIETVSRTIEQTVDFFAGGVYMTNPGNFPFSYGMQVKITGSSLNDATRLVVAFGVNIVQFDPAGPAVVDETGAAITIEFITSGIFPLNRPAFTAMSGIPVKLQSSIYNVLLSPKTSILNNGPLFRSLFDLQDSELFQLKSADKNAELSRTLGGITITENEDIQIGGLGDKLFKPYYITMRTKVPVNVIELINASPFGKIKFTYNGNVFYGFLWDGGIAPAKAGKDNDAQTWKLLSAPENDMRKFNTN